MRNTQINVFAQTLRVLTKSKNEQRQKADEKSIENYCKEYNF